MDVQHLIGEVAARHGIRLDPDDPVFAVATICERALEEASRRTIEAMDQRLGKFHSAAEAVEIRTGKIIAQQMKTAVSQIDEERRRGSEIARYTAVELVARVERAQSRHVGLLWGAAGLVSAAVLFGMGFWVAGLLR